MGAGCQMTDQSGKLDRAEMGQALRMARRSLETALNAGRLADPEELEVPHGGIFREKRAAFVTLKKGGALRGCIGHVMPVEELWRSIRDNAVSAALYDGRFTPVNSLELSGLELDISVLTVPEPIKGLDSYDVGRHGIILELGGARALFLPQVAREQNWDMETTLTHLSMKAGLPPGAWRSPEAKFQVFEAQVFSEHDTA